MNIREPKNKLIHQKPHSSKVPPTPTPSPLFQQSERNSPPPKRRNKPNSMSSNSNNTISDRVWAQAVHSVVDRRLTLRQASQTFGLQQAALHRLVHQHTLQQFRKTSSTRLHSTSPTNSEDSRLSALAIASSNKNTEPSNKHYVFPRLNSVVLGHNSPSGMSLPVVTPLAVMVPPPVCELTPEINDEVVAVLREKFMPQQYDEYETSDGRYDRLEGYADTDIADVARAIVGHNGRRALPPNFPSDNWLATFKRENGFVDVDDMVRCGDRTSSGNHSKVPSQRQLQSHNTSNYELELQKYELEKQQDHEDQAHWIQGRKYRQPATPPSPSPPQHSPIQRHVSYVWDDANGKMDGTSRAKPLQRLRFYPLQHQLRDNGRYRRSPSAGSRNSHSDRYSLPDSTSSDRNYRQSNLVPAKVWEAAMEDVAIHGMSLRNAAKAHGVHFAALHRRLKKRQQHKMSMPCEPNYIPFEDEAGVVRVIHARAEMGVLLTFTELVDLLKRTSLKHRSHLPEDVAAALVRRFQSRVEHSVRHLIVDWPALPNNVLYRLRDTGSPEADRCGLAGGVAAANVGKNSLPSIISRSSEATSLSSSGSSSSLSPHVQSVSGVSFPVHKSPVDTTSTLAWDNVKAGNKTNDDDVNVSAATVSPPSDDNETASRQSCVILRL
ncbi:unnamed protein product [Peronospora farinosa]|uniref:HTH psq-type domain-containing protein n=1 Tax=Peronospora farinosa TaxID=134698 RepID=A0ABN8BYV2_9STRA|nr:unnamed protein product [Peronospora farinosa]